MVSAVERVLKPVQIPTDSLANRIRSGELELFLNDEDVAHMPEYKPTFPWSGEIGCFYGLPFTSTRMIAPGSAVVVPKDEAEFTRRLEVYRFASTLINHV